MHCIDIYQKRHSHYVTLLSIAIYVARNICYAPM